MERGLECELVRTTRAVIRFPVAVPSLLCYRTSDPYAVRVAFHIDSPPPVEWTFARGLLIDGLYRPSGTGDVTIWPARLRGNRPEVWMALTAPDGRDVVRAPAAPVSAWLERTLRIVPCGDERLTVPASPVPCDARKARDRTVGSA
ncbi:SsgA family sporulation/cell division regulator [Streptomyces sp. Ru73]|nr:SsgA family sporulation/cell division regulator [Streptomyces sp. Ru73]